MGHVSLQAAFDQTRQWLESDDLDRAIGMVQHILETYPKCLEAHQMLGEAFLSNRQYEEARIEFEKVLSFDPEHIPALVGLGMTSERLGQLSSAIAAFERALEIKPDLPELRSQLLRLYTEAWGSEYAHLRLSRVGLARLYAKGHMLPQAISEFRQVVADQPDRLDARVALAEALWRDEQEEEALEVCRAILVSHPDVLKANLILGYIELASGNPSGEQYWRKTLTIDPYQSMARMLFESLPPIDVPEPVIPEWDEAAWINRRVTAPVEQLTATRSMEATTPTAVAAPPPPPQASPSVYDDSDDFLAALLAIDTAPPVTSSPVEEAAVEIDADTRPFTLEELGLSEAELERLGAWDEAREQETETPSSQEASPPAETAPAEEAPSEIGALQPFSLEELGLSPEEIAALDSVATPPVETAPAEETPSEIGAVQPFSLEELGLSPEEIAALDSVTTPPAETAPAEEAPSEIGALQPFSLEELGLSPEEIASLDSAATPPAEEAPTEIGALQPFSLEELGLSPEEIASLSGEPILPQAETSQPDDVEIDMQPFSLDDIDIEGGGYQPAVKPGIGFDIGDVPPDLQPFSMEELETGGLSGQTDIGELPPSLQPFSLDEPPAPQRPRMAGLTPEEASESPIEEEEPFIPRGFSWQQPAQRTEPTFLHTASSTAPAETGTIFEKLQKQRESVRLPGAEEPPTPPIAPDEHLGLFSLDDISLRDDDQFEERRLLSVRAEQLLPAVGAPEPPQQEEPVSAGDAAKPHAAHIEDVEDIEAGLASGVIQPFSFADLGLTEEEIAALGLSVAPEQPVTQAPESPAEAPAGLTSRVAEEEPVVAPPHIEEPVATHESKRTDIEAETLEEALARGEVQPFSFADLGLSEEEIAALGLSTPEAAAPPAEPGTPAQPAREAETLEEALARGEVQPFSFADLGLSAEEIAAPGLGTPEASAPPAAPAEPVTPAQPAHEAETLEEALARGEVQPFSFADLGLSEEEIAALGLGEPKASTPPAEPVAPVQPTTETDEFEIVQPAAPAKSPASAAPELVEEETGIEDLQPFSLADLGLSEDELGEFDLSDLAEGGLEYEEGRLGITEEELSALGTGGDLEWLPEPASVHEPPVESFELAESFPGFESVDETVDRLIRLGHERGYVDLADIIATVRDPEAEADRIDEIGRKLHAARIQIRDGDEIIDLDAEYAEEEAPLSSVEGALQPALNDMPSEEDLMRPFSLEELGLSDDEIALLAAAAAGQQENVPPPAEEPSLTPFSLEELGLSDDEIAMISAAGSTVETSPVEESPLTPFSLEDLELSSAEVVQTDKAAATPDVTPPPSTGSEAEAFSLIDLEPVAQPEATVPPQPPAQERKEAPASVVPPMGAEKQPPPATVAAIAAATSPPSPPPAGLKDLSAFPELQEYVRMLDSDPGNHILRLSIARVGGQVGMVELAMQHYRSLIKQNALLDEIVDDLSDMIAETSDISLLRKLHRTLGDAYSRQGRFRDAMREYSWIPGQG
ncbi:MAG: tetratricopeptide repeat protein [Roseiflexus sp.]|uniref:tetratricopeptide repeat protein n=1 Tax=Roseiflexus sp. TaxID=2562120 RepID=UPI0025EA8F28|nr:tetratricopeptide repeat protein [Roseiflexus sp.]MCL6540189.1 tetratricopeptide repeat protein [Roseiflexus sp.]